MGDKNEPKQPKTQTLRWRSVGPPAGELEGPEENANPDTDGIGQKEALEQVSDGVGGAGLVRVVARRAATGPAAAGAAAPRWPPAAAPPPLRRPTGSVPQVASGSHGCPHRRRREGGGSGIFSGGRIENEGD